jgi:acetyl-CoA acetyltransferase
VSAGRRDVAVVGFAQLPPVRRDASRDEAELVQPVVAGALRAAGLQRHDVGFTVSGSCDYLIGRPFSFVSALDGVAPWPPIAESHVEMDGAWALYEAWVRLQQGDIDTALVYAYGKSSLGDLPAILGQQLDPYYLAPLGIDAISLAALQARALLDTGRATEADLAAIAASRRGGDAGELLATPYTIAPLRAHDCAPISDGACAVVLAAGDAARRHQRPAWIRGIDHRVEPHQLGSRDLTRSTSTALAAEHAGVGDAPVDVAELHAPFSFQELILRDALGLGDGVEVNPSGGALASNPMMVAGLARIGEAASRIRDGRARRAVAHATSGPCLQQNLVCVLGAEPAGAAGGTEVSP